MEHIRRLKEEEIVKFVDIAANAYPGFWFGEPGERYKLVESIIKAQQEHGTVNYYGYFRDGELIGGMRFHDFKMRMATQRVDACGLGFVAVDLMHKKEKVAREIVRYFIRYYRERRTPIAMLYPFNPEFYKKMGFGFGTKLNQYSIRPKDLPGGGEKRKVSFLKEEERRLLEECYGRIAESTHGMVERPAAEFNSLLLSPHNKIAVYKNNGRIEGYCVFSFKKASQDNILKNNIVIQEFIYESTEAMLGLMAFLNTQDDQINRIIFNTLDDSFHHLLMNPKDGSDNLMAPIYHETNLQGVGLMYRVTDTGVLFEALKDHDFNGQSCKLKLNITDTLIQENNRSWIIHFDGGRAAIKAEGEYETEVSMDIAGFSSLITGAVDFKTLLRYGIAGISEPAYAYTVHKIFEMPEKPVCIARF